MKPQRYYEELKKRRQQKENFNKGGEKAKMKINCNIKIQSKYIDGEIFAYYI